MVSRLTFTVASHKLHLSAKLVTGLFEFLSGLVMLMTCVLRVTYFLKYSIIDILKSAGQNNLI